MLDRDLLRDLAGSRYFRRGEDYFEEGLVGSVSEPEGVITATVYGSEPYRVKLWEANGEFAFSCTCPLGTEGAFCKHCVAVGLASLEDDDAGEEAEEVRQRGAATMDDVRAYLTGLDVDTLAEMIIEQSFEDEGFRQQLLMRAAKTRSDGLDIATYKRALRLAIEPRGFVSFREAFGYTAQIDEVLDQVQELLHEGHAAEVIDLTEHALKLTEEAMGSVDDSSGCMGDLFRRLQDLHHDACRRAKPDRQALAKKLFEWEMSSDWEVFLGAAETYADVLGPEGLAAYRELAEATWAEAPALGPGDEDAGRYGDRFRITFMMESLARQSGDVEELVDVMRRDLSSPYDFLRIAQAYREAGLNDHALAWAEKGMEAFPTRTDSRLRDFLAAEYHRRDRHDDAMALAWAEFTEGPRLERYQKLKSHADQAGTWPSWRERALLHAREWIGERKLEEPRASWPWTRPVDHSLLVEIALWEDDVETAWREAQAGGCRAHLWMDLASRREADHPEDAAPIYQREAERAIQGKNNDAYREAVSLLEKAHALMARLDRASESREHVERLRAEHKRKRNFIKLLDAANELPDDSSCGGGG